MDMSGAMIAVMAVVMVAMMGGLLWGLVTGLRSRLRGKRSAREILDRRYASGEITSDEYDELRRKLESDGD
jgi:uncharacterized membrane protein